EYPPTESIGGGCDDARVRRLGPADRRIRAGTVNPVDVPVEGGTLRVLRFGTGPRLAVAVHGISASGMSFGAVARHLPDGWSLAAPDLRGRGGSAGLPGPYGMDRHAEDF